MVVRAKNLLDLPVELLNLSIYGLQVNLALILALLKGLQVLGCLIQDAGLAYLKFKNKNARISGFQDFRISPFPPLGCQIVARLSATLPDPI
jgi:hypothetical protein